MWRRDEEGKVDEVAGGGIGKKTQQEIREDQTPLDTPARLHSHS